MKYSVENIERVLDRHVRPRLQEHYGNIILSRIEGNVVYVKLTGQCASCISAQYTVENIVKRELMHRFSDVRDVTIDTFSKDLFQIAKRILNHELES